MATIDAAQEQEVTFLLGYDRAEHGRRAELLDIERQEPGGLLQRQFGSQMGRPRSGNAGKCHRLVRWRLELERNREGGDPDRLPSLVRHRQCSVHRRRRVDRQHRRRAQQRRQGGGCVALFPGWRRGIGIAGHDHLVAHHDRHVGCRLRAGRRRVPGRRRLSLADPGSRDRTRDRAGPCGRVQRRRRDRGVDADQL